MSAFTCPSDQQGRLVLDPRDSEGNPVTLDDGALRPTVVDGDGTYEYNPDGNGLVFRPTSTEGVTHYHVEVDGQPGPGETFLPIDVEMTAAPAGARTVSESVSLEAKGTPA